MQMQHTTVCDLISIS